jgi:integrase
MSTLYRSTFYFEGKKYERKSTISQADAKAKADKLRRDLENGEIGISKKMLVSVWAREWLETYKKPSIAEKGYKQYRHYVEDVIIPQVGNMGLLSVKPIHLQKVLNGRAGNSYSDLKRLRDTIKGIFRKAKQSRLVLYDPAEFLEMPKAENGTHRSITDFERKHFLAVARTHNAGLMFKTILLCGLRPGEVAALSWRDIDFAKQMINVASAMESGREVMKAPKTAAGVRKVPVPDELYRELLERRGEPYSPVFVQATTGKRHTKTSRYKAWQSLVRAMDDSMGAKWEKVEGKDGKKRRKKVLSVIAPDFVPYCLRHTFCTDLQDKGVPLKVASYLMGHSNISVTADIYTHITDSAIDEAARLIGCGHGLAGDRGSLPTGAGREDVAHLAPEHVARAV